MAWTFITSLIWAGIALVIAHTHDDWSQLFYALTVEFLMITGLAMVGQNLDEGVFMSARGAMFFIMCVTVALGWKSREWISQK